MAETVLAKMAIEIAANTSKLNQSLNATQKDLKSFTGGIQKMAGAIGVAFGVQQVTQFAFEISKLAGEAEGVKAAFDRLPESVKLMNDLKDATGGTVSELDLMKRSVQATNFQISLKQLPELFKFATLRAQQTGQSVDYLVDSIVTGIGRKSPLILDNLGISAIRLREKFKGIGVESASVADVTKAVGEIANEELSKMAGFSDNASTKVQQLDATWKNFKITLGQTQFTKGLIGFTDNLLSMFNVILGGNQRVEDLKSQLDLSVKSFNELEQGTIGSVAAFTSASQAAEKLGVKLIKLKDDATGLTKLLIDDRTKFEVIKPGDAAKQIVTLETLQAKIKDLNDQFSETDTVDKKKLANLGSEIIKTQELITELEKLRKAQKPVDYSKHLVSGAKVIFDFNNEDLTKQVADSARAFKNAIKQHEEDFKILFTINDDELLKQLPKTIKDIGTSLTKAVKEANAGLQNAAYETAAVMVDISNQVANGIANIADALGTAIATGDFKNFGRDILNAVADFAQQFGSLLIAQGIALEAFSFGDATTKIIAGAALVAAGAAIKSLTKNTPNVTGARPQGGSGPTQQRFDSPSSQNITFNGEFRVQGNDLVAVLNNTNAKNGRING